MNTLARPLISVIVPVYNVEGYLDACLDSIKQQTYQNLQIIVVEDCSTDRSQQVLVPHLSDPRITCIQHVKNSGLSAARNTGMAVATGEYMMFVDSDDIIDMNLVQACLQGALESAADVVLLSVKPFQDGELVQVVPVLESRAHSWKPIAQAEYFKYEHFAWLKFMRTQLIREQRLEFPVGQYYEDWPFHWQTGFVAAKIVVISDGYYNYRQRGDSITGSCDQKLLHILSSQRLVAAITEQYGACLPVKKNLANKIYSGMWFVLTTIDKKHLKQAVVTTKAHLEATRKYRSYGSASLKARLLLVQLKLPVAMAVLTITGMRSGLQWLSPMRRKARR